MHSSYPREKRILLAYSGGLDTSIALHWLKRQHGAQIFAFCANLGQYENLETIEARALSNGATEIFFADLREEFIADFAFPALRAGGLYEGKYHMAAALSRPAISRKMIEIAKRIGADAVAHGATGKGNDQVRFYTSIASLNPELQVLAPVIEWDLTTRSRQLEYARRHNLALPPLKTTSFSRDSNLWGSSAECGPLDDITSPACENAYTLTKDAFTKTISPIDIAIRFETGTPVAVNDSYLRPHELVTNLNELGGERGIGRIDILENRLIGLKTRGIYESPAAEILHVAARELENLVLERSHLHFRTQLAQKYAELIYEGHWFSGLRTSLDAFFSSFGHLMTGTITLRLHTGRLTIVSRSSPFSLYNTELSSYESDTGFNQELAQAFSYIWSTQGRIRALSAQQREHERSSDEAQATG